MSGSRAKCMIWLAEIWRNAEQLIFIVPMVEPSIVPQLDHKYTELFDWIQSQDMPLKPAGVMTLMREEKRIADTLSIIIFSIFEKMNRRSAAIWKGVRAQSIFRKAIDKVLDIHPYDVSAQEEFLELMKVHIFLFLKNTSINTHKVFISQ